MHGTALVAPYGREDDPAGDDEGSRRCRLELQLPPPLGAKRWERVTTDRVRIQEPLPALEPADPVKLPVVLNPFSLTVLTASA